MAQTLIFTTLSGKAVYSDSALQNSSWPVPSSRRGRKDDRLGGFTWKLLHHWSCVRSVWRPSHLLNPKWQNKRLFLWYSPGGSDMWLYSDRCCQTKKPKHQYSFDGYFLRDLQRTPGGKSSITVKLECTAFWEWPLWIEMIVKRGVDWGKLLEAVYAPKKRVYSSTT